MSRFIPVIACGLLVCPSYSLRAESWEKPFKHFLKQGCYITAQLVLEEELIRHPADPRLTQVNKKYERFLRQQSRRDPSYALECYWKGWLVWQDADYEAAQSYWYRYLEIKGKQPPWSSNPQLAEVSELYDVVCEHLIEPEQEPSPQPTETPEVLPSAQAPQRNRRRAHKRSHVPFTDPRVASEQLVQKAMRAEKDGQMESAYRFYKLAEHLTPESPQIQSKLIELKKMVE